MASTKTRRRRTPPAEPFHAAMRRLRLAAFHQQALIAGAAGVTVAVYDAMEHGHAPVSLAVYTAACARYSALSAYPPPPPDPTVLPRRVHPAVQFERDRTEHMKEMFKKLNPNLHNRKAAKELMDMVRAGLITQEDQDWFL